MIRSKRQAGFTLIELLTVIAIIMILAALIMPAVFKVQESARIADCRNNLRELKLLILQYATTYGGYLPAFWHERYAGELGLVGKGWGTLIDDLNPNIASAWNNLSPTERWLRNRILATNTYKNLGYTGGYADQGERRTIKRSASLILLCKSDTSWYRCDQGNLISYMGLAKYGWWHRGNLTASASFSDYHQIQEFDNTSKRILLCETEPGTWQLGGCGCRWHAYRHPVFIVPRHYKGGHILFFDGHIEIVKGARSRPWNNTTLTDRMIRYWEEDYDQTNPGW